MIIQEVMKRFKGPDLIDIECLKNYGQKFVTLYRRCLPKKKCKKVRQLSEEALQIAEIREVKDKEKGKDIPS